MTIAQNGIPFLVKLSKESGPATLSMMLLMYVTVIHDCSIANFAKQYASFAHCSVAFWIAALKSYNL